jgi:hypothetical protein
VHRLRLQLEGTPETLLQELDVLLVLGVLALDLDPGLQPDRQPWIRTSPWTTPPGTTLTSVSTVSTEAPPAPRLASSRLNPMSVPPVRQQRLCICVAL